MESREKIDHLEKRVDRLELNSHPPRDFSSKIRSLEDAYKRLYDLYDKLYNFILKLIKEK